MKKLTFIGIAVIIFSACEKLDNMGLFDKKEVLCPTVTAEGVNTSVKEAFILKYPGAVVTTWFNKDNTGYCAEFTQNGVKTLTQFNNDGTFVKEENSNQDDEHKDNDKGCSCELEDAD